MSKDIFFHGLGRKLPQRDEEFYGLGQDVGITSGNVVLGWSDKKFNVPKYPTMLGDPPQPQSDEDKKKP